jgi:hypothetical protein
MKKVLLAGVAGIAFVTGSAHAADLGRQPITRHPRPQRRQRPLGPGATSEPTSVAVGGAQPPLLQVLPRGFPSPVTPAALLAAARLVAIINSHQIG